MKYSIALFAGLLLPMAQAQPTRTPPTPAEMAQHEVSRYTTLLTLTAEQQETATSAFTTAASTEQPLHASERTAHQALEAAIKANEVTAIQQAATTLGQIQGEMTAARALAEAKFYASLTDDQKAKYMELERHEWHGGPGGPRGPEGPPPAH